MRRDIERQHLVAKEAAERDGDDARVAREKRLVDLVDEVVRRVPPPAERVAHLHGARRLMADAAVHRRDADAPEGGVAGARGTLAFVMLAALGERRLLGERHELGDDAVLGEDGRSDAARRIDIHMGDAAPLEIVEMRVGVPGRPRIAPMRMAGPEADAQAPPPGAAPLGHQPRRFQHGGVGAAIIHHAVIPGVVMAGEEHEGRILAAGTVELGDEERRLAPARIDLGMERDRDLAAAGELRPQGLAIGLGDGAGDGRGHLGERLVRGAAPDGRDAHLVEMLMGRDMQLARGAGRLGARRDRGARNAVDEHDLAAAIGAREIGFRPVTDIDELGREPGFRRRQREGMGDALELAPIGLDARAAGQADIGVMREELGAIAVSVEAGLQIAEALELLRRPGKLHALGEFDAMAHQLGRADGGAEARNHLVHASAPSTRRAAARSAAT